MGGERAEDEGRGGEGMAEEERVRCGTKKEGWEKRKREENEIK